MFKIFKRRKDKPALSYGIVQRFGMAVEQRQRQVAYYLNQKTKGYGKQKWTLLLFSFCVLVGGIASYILVASIQTKQQGMNNDEWRQSSISIPSTVLQEGKQWDTLEMLEAFYQHRNDSVRKVQKKSNYH